MPIYEFYCQDCNTIFQFFARAICTDKQPDCPQCGRKRLPKAVSLFAIAGRTKEPAAAETSGGGGEDSPFDDAKMEHALEALAAEAEHIDENDPKQAARLMRKLTDMTGLEMGETMKEAMARLESGEDPEAIEEDLGPALEDEDPFTGMGQKKEQASGKTTALRRPLRRDEKIYDL